MARASRGPGYAGLIVFIVLCVVLIGGYVWLFPAYAKIGDSLDRLHVDIKKNLEDGIKGLGARASAKATRYDVAYDQAFFSKVAQLANKGTDYDKLAEVVGFTGQDAVAQINDELAKAERPNLREYVLSLEREVTNLEAELSTANGALKQADLDRRNAIKLAEEESLALKEANMQAAQNLDAARQRFLTDLRNTKDLMERAAEDAQKAWGENSAQAERFKTEVASLQDRIRRLDQERLELREELEAKKPKPPEITQGRISQVSLTDEIAIIDLGKREGVQTGDTFHVMRLGKGGEMSSKAEIKVTVVEDIIAQADIIEHSLQDPIVRGDVVVRQKRPEEI